MKYLLRDFVRFVLGPLCFFAALWLPFYIGGVLLPEGWARPGGPMHWWDLPMFVTLLAMYVGLFALGIRFVFPKR